MKIDLYTPAGVKKESVDLPPSVFEQPIRMGLMHQAVVLQQSNRRCPIAHARHRGEMRGSTRKLYAQKGTGRARRGPIRSPLLRGGGKSFGPRNERNFTKGMPRGMRHAALLSSLSFQAKRGTIVGLESYPDRIKTKEAVLLLGKLPVELGRKILVVAADIHQGLMLSTRNIPGVKAIRASYLNPEDVLGARYIIFLEEAIRKAEEVFGKQPKEPKQLMQLRRGRASSASSESSHSTYSISSGPAASSHSTVSGTASGPSAVPS